MQKTVLLVEDDESVRRLIRRILDTAGYEVREARDGLEALDLWIQSRSGLVITDLDMPKMGGEELVERLLNTDGLLRFLIISGRPKMLPGHWPCLLKPFPAQALLRQVESLFSDG